MSSTGYQHASKRLSASSSIYSSDTMGPASSRRLGAPRSTAHTSGHDNESSKTQLFTSTQRCSPVRPVKAKTPTKVQTIPGRERLLPQSVLPDRLPPCINAYRSSTLDSSHFIIGGQRDKPLYIVSLHGRRCKEESSVALYSACGSGPDEPISTAGYMARPLNTPGDDSEAGVSTRYVPESTENGSGDNDDSDDDPSQRERPPICVPGSHKWNSSQETIMSSTDTDINTSSQPQSRRTSPPVSQDERASMRAANDYITLPRLPWAPESTTMAREQLYRDHNSGKSAWYRFSIETSPCGQREEFEWRKSSGEPVRLLGGSCLGGWKLVRIGTFDKAGRSLRHLQDGIEHFPAYDQFGSTKSGSAPVAQPASKSGSSAHVAEKHISSDTATSLDNNSACECDKDDDTDDNAGGPSATSFTCTDGNEVVAAWARSSKRRHLMSCCTNTKRFRFGFYGTGATGILGERFALMALMSALRIWDVERKSKTRAACRRLTRRCE